MVSQSNIITQPTDTSAAAPFNEVFTCSVIGYGYQNITWYKKSGTLPHKHKTIDLLMLCACQNKKDHMIPYPI